MKKLSSVLLIILLTFSLSACKKKVISNEDPQTILNKAWEKQVDQQLDSGKGTVTVEGKGKLSIDKSVVEMSGKGEVKFNNQKDNERFGVHLNLVGNGDLEGKKGNFDISAEIRWVEKKLYVFMENLGLKTDDPQFNVMANLVSNFYKSQWIEFPLEQFNPSLLSPAMGDKAKEAAIRDVAKKNPFLDAMKDIGDRTYEVKINPEKLITYLTEMNKVAGNTAEMPGAASIQKFLQDLNYVLQMKINEDYALTWIKVEGNAEDTETKQKAELSFQSTLDDRATVTDGKLSYTGKQTGSIEGHLKTDRTSTNASIELPKDAKPFDLGGLLGGIPQ